MAPWHWCDSCAIHAMTWRGAILNKDKRAGWRGTLALVRQLRNTHYDLVVDLRTDGLTLLLRAGQRLTRRKARTRGYHAVERHFGVVAGYLDNIDMPAATLWLCRRRNMHSPASSFPAYLGNAGWHWHLAHAGNPSAGRHRTSRRWLNSYGMNLTPSSCWETAAKRLFVQTSARH